MSAAVVFGGYGVFGSRVAAELVRLGVRVTVAGRDPARAEAAARALGPGHRSLAADLRDPGACREALAGHAVAVVAAGPFSAQGSALLEACLEASCHYVDIAEDRGHVARVRALGAAFARRGRAAVFGASSLPGISGALALTACQGATSPPERARVTLFIGDDNPKGGAAVRAAVRALGRPIAAPQGTLRGFRGHERVVLPPPFGERSVHDFDAPDYDLLPGLVGVSSVRVKVGFESRPATYLFAALAELASGYGERTARLLGALARIPRRSRLRRTGSSGGAVQVELYWPGGAIRRVALVAAHDGQEMAALPAAFAAKALLDGATACGAMTVHDLLGATPLLERLAARGLTLTR